MARSRIEVYFDGTLDLLYRAVLCCAVLCLESLDIFIPIQGNQGTPSTTWLYMAALFVMLSSHDLYRDSVSDCQLFRNQETATAHSWSTSVGCTQSPCRTSSLKTDAWMMIRSGT